MSMTLSPPRPLLAVARGFGCHCPNCGKTRLFEGYLTLVDHCEHCGERFSHIRADDLPAYLTIFIVGHVVVGLMLETVRWGVPNWAGISSSLIVTVCLTLWLLPKVKGAVAAHLWLLKMARG